MKNVIAGLLTVVSAAALYEVSLIGTRALAEDASFVKACATAVSSGKGKKVKKILRRK